MARDFHVQQHQQEKKLRQLAFTIQLKQVSFLARLVAIFAFTIHLKPHRIREHLKLKPSILNPKLNPHNPQS